jgi:hypothetical protein
VNWRDAHPDLVEHDATFNSLTEYYEPEGTKLENGMRVLVANENRRSNLKFVNELFLLNALASNRWCKVTKFQIIDGYVMFLGVYDDGSVVPRKYRPEVGWLVKRDSVPKPDDSNRGKTFEAVVDLVDKAMKAKEIAIQRGGFLFLEEIRDDIAEEIMKIFGGTE